jgi:hypothetical protein
MERRNSRPVFNDYFKTLRLEELLPQYKCPICRGEMIAREGGKDDPYYWKCVEGCYSRNIDQPHLQGDELFCSNCNGELEYGEWGGKPAWRCKNNRHHHQKLFKSHLKLPKMYSKIPSNQLRKMKEDIENYMRKRKVPTLFS